MQQIVAENSIFSEIPYFIRRIYTKPKIFSDYVITSGPVLYEIKDKQILASCDLSQTPFKGLLELL